MKKYFFNQTLKRFQEHSIENQKLLVGVSGGLDSMVLLDLLKELSSVLKLKLSVIHIHHGDLRKESKNKAISDYRDQALELVSQACKALDFISVKNTKVVLKNEEEMRNFRHKHFKSYLKKLEADKIVLAHHRNDLLETRLIHLIRGCGSKGLKAMEMFSSPYLRPLLDFSRQEIQKYADSEKLHYLEDPSNQDPSFLRNWIRHRWLVDLEKKRPGAVKTLSRSLEALSLGEAKQDPALLVIDSQKIKRQEFMELTYADQKRALAFYMRQLKLSNYGQSHIEELIKHNQRTEKQFQVRILKRNWQFDSDFIQTLD